jgi:hypothetical protein
MSAKKLKQIKHSGIYLMTLIYLMIACTYIFFMPNRATEPSSKCRICNNSIFKRRRETPGESSNALFHRIDRVTPAENKKNNFILAITLFVSLVTLFFSLKGWKIKIKFRDDALYFLNSQYTYLSICSFRI